MVLNIAVIGAGGMGREHVTNLTALPGADVTVVADVVLANAESIAELAGAAASADPLGTVQRAELDAVVIASPDETHADLAIAAIEAGHDVLCEKPLASTVADAERVIAAEAASGRSLVQVGFMRPYDEAHRRLHGRLHEIGAIQHVRAVHRNTNHQWERSLDVVLSQSVIHDVHTVRWLSGSEFTSVSTHVVGRHRPVDHVVVVGSLADGTTATIEFVEAAYGYDVEVEVTGDRGMVVCAQPAQPVVRRDGSAHRFIGADWFGRFRDAYRAEVADWVDGLVHREVRGPNTADGLAAQRVVEAALASARSGQPEMP